MAAGYNNTEIYSWREGVYYTPYMDGLLSRSTHYTNYHSIRKQDCGYILSSESISILISEKDTQIEKMISFS